MEVDGVQRMCLHCGQEMINDCKVNVEGGLYGIKIIKKNEGLFKNVSASPKAAVCPDCGSVALYISEYDRFKEQNS